jgi:hypothetical protein
MIKVACIHPQSITLLEAANQLTYTPSSKDQWYVFDPVHLYELQLSTSALSASPNNTSGMNRMISHILANLTATYTNTHISINTDSSEWVFNNRVVQSCHLLATYHVTYFTTYLIRRTRRRAISGIMNFVDAYSQAPTYCLCLSGRLFGNPNSGCSPDLFSLTCLLFPCVVVPSLIIASLVFSHTPPLLLGQRIHLLSRWLVQS